MRPRTYLGSALALAGLGAAGFAVRPRPANTTTAVGEDRGTVPLATDIPPLLRQHLDVDGDGHVPRMDSVGLWARPRLRIGPSPWLHATMRSLRSGAEFVNDIDVTWYGRPALHVIDAYVDGHGITRVANRSMVNSEIDQGANLFLWSEAVLIPAEFAEGTRLRASQEDSWTVRLEVPFQDQVETAWLAFAGGVPRRFSALRYKQRGAPKVWWYVDFGEWRIVHGIRMPMQIDVAWADEGRPWMTVQLDSFASNIDVHQRITEVREIVRTARATKVPS